MQEQKVAITTEFIKLDALLKFAGVAPCVILPAQEGEEDFLYMVLPVRLKAGE